MRPRTVYLVSILVLSTQSIGCTAIQSYWNHHFNVNGSIPTVSNKNDRFSQVDLVAELTQGGRRPTECGPAGPDDSSTSEACLSAAFSQFYSIHPDSNVPATGPASAKSPLTDGPVATSAEECSDYSRRHLGAAEKARNRIQDHLIAASELACSDFQQQLNTFQSNSNFLLGVASIAAGGAGAIVTSVDAARALAGSAAAISGVRAEWNTDLFAKLIVSTITKAINSKRDEWVTTLRGSCVNDNGETVSRSTSTNTANPSLSSSPDTSPSGKSGPSALGAKASGKPPGTKAGADAGSATTSGEASSGNDNTATQTKTFKIGRQQLSIDVYSVEAAVGDALVYNDLCSLDRGLEFVNASVDTAANPGLDAMKAYLDKLKDVNQSLQNAFQASSTSKSAGQPAPVSPSPGGATGH